MKCPFCGCLDTQVKDSRANEDASAIRRRRVCPECGSRFTTLETVQLRELMVIKRNKERVPFSREKLYRSVQLAVRKRPINADRLEKIVNGIIRQLEAMGDMEITSEQIGKTVMETLFTLDKVAFIRYASVYKNFNTIQDFKDLMEELIEK